MLDDVLKTAVGQEPKILVLLNEENVMSAAFVVCDTICSKEQPKTWLIRLCICWLYTTLAICHTRHSIHPY